MIIPIAQYKKIIRRNCFGKKYKKFRFILDKDFANFKEDNKKC